MRHVTFFAATNDRINAAVERYLGIVLERDQWRLELILVGVVRWLWILFLLLLLMTYDFIQDR